MSRFKRNTEIVDKVNEITNSAELTDEQKVALRELVSEYEYSTYKENSDRHEFYRNVVDDMVNDMSFEYKKLAEKMANNHPTLQQSFMRMCAYFINRMAEKTYYDDRNKASVEYAKSVVDNVGGKYFPFI